MSRNHPSRLERELRELLDPLPDGPYIKYPPFASTFRDEWVSAKPLPRRPSFITKDSNA